MTFPPGLVEMVGDREDLGRSSSPLAEKKGNPAKMNKGVPLTHSCRVLGNSGSMFTIPFFGRSECTCLPILVAHVKVSNHKPCHTNHAVSRDALTLSSCHQKRFSRISPLVSWTFYKSCWLTRTRSCQKGCASCIQLSHNKVLGFATGTW